MTEYRAPRGLKTSGKKLWQAVTDEFDLQDHELTILKEACRTVDTLDGLQTIVDRDGLTMTSPQGVKAHPALVELRNQRVTLAKLVASLRIPLDDDQSVGRLEQQRVGYRQIAAVK
ncbi:hypothetical protein GCM10009670_04230 [Citricoccus alkalitolerans]